MLLALCCREVRSIVHRRCIHLMCRSILVLRPDLRDLCRSDHLRSESILDALVVDMQGMLAERGIG
jgi:hypothetical protein